MKSAIAFGMLGVGLLCLATSVLWSALSIGSSAWTPEKGQRWTDVKDRLHNLSFVINGPPNRVSMHGGPDMATLKQEYDGLRTENEELKAQFESAYNSPRTTSTILKWTGISLAGIGIVGWLAVRES
jgi:hypothetical protein